MLLTTLVSCNGDFSSAPPFFSRRTRRRSPIIGSVFLLRRLEQKVDRSRRRVWGSVAGWDFWSGGRSINQSDKEKKTEKVVVILPARRYAVTVFPKCRLITVSSGNCKSFIEESVLAICVVVLSKTPCSPCSPGALNPPL